MGVGDKYVLVDPLGHAGPIIESSGIIAESGKPISISVYVTGNVEYKRKTVSDHYPSCSSDSLWGISQIVMSDRPGAGAYKSDNTMILGKEWKVIPLFKSDYSSEKYESDSKLREVFKPGSMDSMLTALSKDAELHNMIVYGESLTDPKFHITFDGIDEGTQLSVKDAEVRLVMGYGLGVETADEIMKEACAKGKAKRFIKLAQLVGVNMPPPPQPLMGYDSFAGIPVEYSSPQGQMIPGTTVGKEPRLNPVQPGFNLYQQPMGDGPVDLARQAAEAGQKQVFDHASIGGLTKLHDIGALVDTYIPAMEETMDKIGRTIFLFYWKNEDFTERYGEDKLQEMEDLLRAVFGQLGDLILQLREKSIQSEGGLVQ
jgi:hypothetical protein